MIATFCLTALDISHRMIAWLRGRALDWERLMVLITGQSGRATAGLTWSSNNMCHLLARASNGRLAPARLYIVPHATDLAPTGGEEGDRWHRLEQQYRTLWFNTSVNAELAGRMFEGYPRYRFALPQAPVIDRTTEWVSELPAVASAQDMFALGQPAALCARGSAAADLELRCRLRDRSLVRARWPAGTGGDSRILRGGLSGKIEHRPLSVPPSFAWRERLSSMNGAAGQRA